MRSKRALLSGFLALTLVAPAVHAGTFSITAWNDDASTGITGGGQNAWAWHFGSTAPATVNGVSVPGRAGGVSPITQAGQFSITGLASVSNNDINLLTLQNGTGTPVMANDFIYGGNPGTIQLQGLTPGMRYAVSIFGVGFEAPVDGRVTFASGADSLLVAEDQFGNNAGIRVDYTFVATGATQTITLTPQRSDATWHLYALSLNLLPVEVFNPSFETPALSANGYTSSIRGGGWSNPGSLSTSFFEHIPGFSAEGNQHLGLEQGAEVWQDLDLTYQANTVYRLRVAIGNRPGYTVSGNTSRYTFTDPTEAATPSAGYDAFSNAPTGTFIEAPPLMVDTAVTTALVGKTIRIRLKADGAGRSHFDHVRLDSAKAADKTVTTTADSGPGSLRSAVANAAILPGADTISFDPALSGQTITLASELLFTDSNPVTLDASSLPGGITLSGGGSTRILRVAPGASCSLTALTLANGKATVTGAPIYGYGSGIHNSGTLTVNRCTFTGNATAASQYGGAIFNASGATLTVNQCTIAGNAAHVGGGIANDGTLTVTHSTLAGNSGSNRSGGIDNNGTLTLTHSIVATNTAPGLGDDVSNFSTVTRNGTCIVQQFSNDGTVNGSGTFLNTDPLLAPLASNGGPTQTMPPRPGSPAIDAASGSSVTADQRGLPIRDGDGNGSAIADIGAAEFQRIVVTTSADQDDTPAGFTLSLREALRDDASGTTPAEIITFSPELNGQTISLSSEIVISSDVTIDATGLPGGVTIDDGAATTYRLFNVGSGRTVEMRALTLANGGGPGLGDAGAIRNQGNLTLTRCTIAGCRSSNDAGALLNAPTASLTLTQCTLSGNQTGNAGGALRNQGMLSLTHCTLSGNTGGQGGAIHNSGPFTLAHSIVSGNSAPGADKDILNTGASAVLTKTGTSLVQGLDHSSGGGETGSGTLSNAAPLLAPLASNGGPGPTHALLAGSPAIDAATGSTVTTDQRGILVSGMPDLGAYEFLPNGLTVTTTADSGTGSLRAAIAHAAILPGADTITFAPALSGLTITLASEIVMDMANAGNVTVDASSLPAGITIDGGPGTNRIFYIDTSGTTFGTVTLVGLTLTGGNGTGAGAGFSRSGGAISKSFVTLALTQCTLSGNASTDNGGAIYNRGGTLTLTQCTLSGNSSDLGGAIFNEAGTLALTQCTVSGSSAAYGGAILNAAGTLALTQCTVSGNSADIEGGAIYNHRTLTLTNSIIAGNSAGEGDDIRQVNLGAIPTYTRIGGNIVPLVSNSGTVNESGPAAITANPLLAPLGSYGGPTQTMALLPGSPARNAATDSSITADQRGFPIVGIADIGAFEFGSGLEVTSNANSGPGSLRTALANAAMLPDADTVTFAPALNGQTISLGSEIVINSDVTLDATSLPAGMRIDDGTATTYRLFTVNSGQTVELRGLTLANGGGPGLGDAGAIRNQGNLTLTRCTIAGCRSSNDAGALLNTATGTLTLMQCTLSGNQTGNAGGALRNQGTLSLTHCTVSSNTGGQGGAIHNSGPFTLAHSIVAGNTAPGADKDILNTGASAVLTKLGTSLVTNLLHSSSGSETGGGSLNPAAPLLAPLGSYGGPTQTMALLPASPARNAATGSTITSDQRGFPITGGLPDIGAYEAGTFSNYNTWIYETLPATATTPQRAGTFDFDGDGQTNDAEWTALTDPGSATSRFTATPVLNGANLEITVPTAIGRTYQVQSSPNLANPWTNVGPAIPGTGGSVTQPVDVTGLTRHFFRVTVSGP